MEPKKVARLLKKKKSGSKPVLEKQPTVEEERGLVSPDRTGWSPHESERRDFYNRIRAFPPEVSTWRKRLTHRLADQPESLRLKEALPVSEISARLDDGIVFLREVARILALLYATPDLGNKQDPVDELVYIILSRKTPRKSLPGRIPPAQRSFCVLG